jgi:prepilin-type N-terminal cleavage/methylation domain-containing protein
LRGFTLIELMIVVVIIGVLASLATYSVTNYIQMSKTSEAREVVGSIMAAQEAFFDETSAYLDATGGVTDDDFYPHGNFNGRTVIQWGGADSCSGFALDGVTAVPCVTQFAKLGVFVNKAVMFRYASTTFGAGSAPPVPATYVTKYNPGNITAPRDGYVVVAMSDLDDDGTSRSVIVGSSLQSDLYGENLGD